MKHVFKKFPGLESIIMLVLILCHRRSPRASKPPARRDPAPARGGVNKAGPPARRGGAAPSGVRGGAAAAGGRAAGPAAGAGGRNAPPGKQPGRAAAGAGGKPSDKGGSNDKERKVYVNVLYSQVDKSSVHVHALVSLHIFQSFIGRLHSV